MFVAYLAATTALGFRLGRSQRTATSYFVADRDIPWWAVMFSVVASETSALTFISIPGLSYAGNLGFLQVCAGYILGRIVVASVLLPRYFDGKLVTAYTLLETRFGMATRRFTAIVFLATRGLADSVRVFATAIPNVRDGQVVGYTSVRRKPSRAKVNECIALYAQMRAEELK